MESQSQVLHEIMEQVEALSGTKRAEVLDYVLFLRQREQAAIWDAISDADAEILRSEFAVEDVAMAEELMVDYHQQLRQQDEA